MQAEPFCQARGLPDALATIHLESEFLAVREGLGQVLCLPDILTLGADLRGRVEIVLVEVLNNIVEHAYAGQTGSIQISLRLLPDRLVCHVLDKGRPFPAGAPPPGTLAEGRTLTDLSEGGYGWHLIRAITTDLHYTRTEDTNHLRFSIPLQTPPPHCA
jgi:serine/threonine-protein kinase RsbW